MSYTTYVKREAGKFWMTLYVSLFVVWKLEAIQTGRSYNAIAEAKINGFTDALVEFLLSLGPRVAMGILLIPMFGFAAYRFKKVMRFAEHYVHRNGMLTSLFHGAVLVGAILLWFEAASDLPAWARPEALMQSQTPPVGGGD